MQVMLDPADGVETRRVVSDRRVRVAVDQPRCQRHPGGIDHPIGGLDALTVRTDGGDLVVLDQDGVRRQHRLLDVAADELSDVDDRGAGHHFFPR